MFADVYINIPSKSEVFALPEQSLVRSTDGDWQVFVEQEPGHFVAVEVEPERQLGRWRVVTGIEPGLRVVTAGAFFIASELAKSGFSAHNH